MSSSLLDYQQPAIPSTEAAAAAQRLLAFRIMAFVTGVVLLTGTIMLIVKYGTSAHVEPFTGYLWLAHGWLFLVYVITVAFLGVKLRWPYARFALVMLAGTIPTMSFVAEHFVTRAAKAQAVPARD